MKVCNKCNDTKGSRHFDQKKVRGYNLRDVCRRCRILASAVGHRAYRVVINK